MAPQNTNSDTMQVQEVAVVPAKKAGGGREQQSQEESVSEASIDRIPLRHWVMNGAVMFGREFCYAMETALVTPVLLQIGLPEQYYSLTWFLSPILGLIFTPLIGSASDRCTLRWGRRRPFILALCVGVLFGVALFLNGSLIGLAFGDEPNNQPIGIVLTVLGVVVLDFSADASEGPIRAYLLDVADTEEQDMALNIHAFSAGLEVQWATCWVVLTGLTLSWDKAFKSQEQILFVFTPPSSSPCRWHCTWDLPYDPYEDAGSERDLDMGFLDVDIVRSKSDSVLAMADTALDLDRDPLFLHEIEPSIFQDHLPSSVTLSVFLHETDHNGEEALLSSQDCVAKAPNGKPAGPDESVVSNGANGHTHPGMKQSQHQRLHAPPPPPHLLPPAPPAPSHTTAAWDPTATATRRANAVVLIKSSRSMNDIYEMQERRRRKQRQRLRHQNAAPELLRLCVCHLLTWLALITEAVFYTDFMGQVVFDGNPKAAANTTELLNYHKGVQMGCWGLVVYAVTSAICSALLQKYLDNFDLSIKIIYILGTLGFAIGTVVMAIFPNVYVSMVMISSMGIIFMSICYCPYALLGQYHEMKTYIRHSPGNSKRGFGIDCAILSCQVYISQILVASALGSVVDLVGSVRVVPMVASGSSFLGFLTATFLVIYPNPHADDGKGEPGKSPARAQHGQSDGAEKPSVLKLTRKGTTTTTTCKAECESTL
ncbi:hypothetical protein SKAU_G00396990 [Synaphobranchus kaupii]|uniref:Solute carrier family 45 member 4 n=1 Tax=Synaphobranchus kaupii TaxID=118154 RepID=A0A9Q1E8B0_SYNKA|nr:hypothetical protein SKAU_G00396990 [Synaphobranchus kaupii]